MPAAAGPIRDRDVCLYTNTAKADRRPDQGGEFIIDRWPKNKRLIIGSACSGHGAKFAPAIGERLANLATDRNFRSEPFFRLSRYLAFPGDVDPQREDALEFYQDNYELVFSRCWERTERHELSDGTLRKCRFCGKGEPHVTFGTEAHAVPEMLGNRGLTSAYECDACNGHFGRGIENDLGEWFKPLRTFARVRGKNGVPKLAKGSSGGWRIQYTPTGFDIKSYEDEPIHVIDQVSNTVTFTLKRGSFTPVAVFKAFVKIGLTLIPEDELGPFNQAFAWIRETDHSRSFVHQITILHTFISGRLKPDQVAAFVLRRKSGVTDVPYAWVAVAYGNEVFQAPLPAPAEDASLNNKTFPIYGFPTPEGPDP